MLEDGFSASDRTAAAMALLAAFTAGGPGAVAIIIPSRSDFDARVTSHVSTFSADLFFVDGGITFPNPLELLHALMSLVHWPKMWDRDRCCIANAVVRDVGRALASVDIVLGGAVFRSQTVLPAASATSFDAIGRTQKPVSDKISIHKYGTLYEEVLSPIRARAKATGAAVRLLEIGLGCGMTYGEGAGPLLWRAYFEAGLELTILEFAAECAEAWGARDPNTDAAVYTGDQRNVELLRRVIDERGPFDIVVDDGGHCQACQIATVDAFPIALAPGGVLVIEDLFSSLHPSYNADAPPTTVAVLSDIADSIIVRGPQYEEITRYRVATRAGGRSATVAIAGLIERMVCEAEICALVRSF